MGYKDDFSFFWKIYQGDWVQCWYPGCGAQAIDIAHIDPKGMGGRASVEYIENYCPLCRKHHNLTEGRQDQKLTLYQVVIQKVFQKYPNHQYSERFIASPWYPQLAGLIPKT